MLACPFLVLLSVCACTVPVRSFSPPQARTDRGRLVLLPLSVQNNGNNLQVLQEELTRYLAKRKELGADESSAEQVGKVIGGTRGNKVLEFISAAPSKEVVLNETANIFDYSELEKYSYGYLAKPIMEAGGRLEMYKLMGLEPPKSKPITLESEPCELVIDRTGKTDQGRYKGMSLTMNDDILGQQLQEVQRKAVSGERVRPKIQEEDYVQPFSDKRNVGPQQKPLWTADKLDEQGRKQGRAVDWARQAKAGAFVKDPLEILAIDGDLRTYSVVSSLLVAFAFGETATYSILDLLQLSSDLQRTLQAPSMAILVANVGSSILAYGMAPTKNRSKFVWGIKGLFGGPLAIAQLRGSETLRTRAEIEDSSQVVAR